MILPLLHFIGRWTRRLLKGLFWVVVAYPFLLLMMYLTEDAVFPNGAWLQRNIDWEMIARHGPEQDPLTRIDLYLPDGRLIARRVDWLCWNETALSGKGVPQGFVWLGQGHEVNYRDDPDYDQAYETSRLGTPLGPCEGYHNKYLPPDVLFWDNKWMRPGKRGLLPPHSPRFSPQPPARSRRA